MVWARRGRRRAWGRRRLVCRSRTFSHFFLLLSYLGRVLFGRGRGSLGLGEESLELWVKFGLGNVDGGDVYRFALRRECRFARRFRLPFWVWYAGCEELCG